MKIQWNNLRILLGRAPRVQGSAEKRPQEANFTLNGHGVKSSAHIIDVGSTLQFALLLCTILLIGCKLTTNTMSTRPWLTEAPNSLTEDFYRSHTSIEGVDTGMWLYLLSLIAEDQRPYRIRKAEMLNSVSPELRRYFLTRGFDWERGSGGLEACLMHAPDDDDLLLDDTIRAYEALGAFKHAAIIRELIPKARDRMKRIEEADAKGQEFNYDDGLWEPYEKRWDAACEEFNFYDVIWKDIQNNPKRYTHSK